MSLNQQILASFIKKGLLCHIQEYSGLPKEVVQIIIKYGFSFGSRYLFEYRTIPEETNTICRYVDCNQRCDWCNWKPIFDLSLCCTSDYTIHKILKCKSDTLLKIQLDLNQRRRSKEFIGYPPDLLIPRLNQLYFSHFNIQFRLRYFPLLDEEEREWIQMQEIR